MKNDLLNYLQDFNSLNSGMGLIFKFPNNYGASLVCHSFSYGGKQDKFELAVIYFDEDNKWDLCYSTLITNDVLGYLSKEKCFEVLEKIKLL